MFLSKMFTILLSLCLVVSPAFAQTSTSSGAFSILEKGDKAPFSGTLFDPTATAIILADKEDRESFFKLKLKYELDKQAKNYDLKLSNVKLQLDTKTKVSDSIQQSLKKQLKETQDIALSKNDYTWLYVGGGFLVGVLITGLSVWLMGQLNGK